MVGKKRYRRGGWGGVGGGAVAPAVVVCNRQSPFPNHSPHPDLAPQFVDRASLPRWGISEYKCQHEYKCMVLKVDSKNTVAGGGVYCICPKNAIWICDINQPTSHKFSSSSLQYFGLQGKKKIFCCADRKHREKNTGLYLRVVWLCFLLFGS